MDDNQKKSFFDEMHHPLAAAVMELHNLLDKYVDSPMKTYAKQKVDEAYLWATQIFQAEMQKEAERLAELAKAKLNNPVASEIIDAVEPVIEKVIEEELVH